MYNLLNMYKNNPICSNKLNNENGIIKVNKFPPVMKSSYFTIGNDQKKHKVPECHLYTFICILCGKNTSNIHILVRILYFEVPNLNENNILGTCNICRF